MTDNNQPTFDHLLEVVNEAISLGVSKSVPEDLQSRTMLETYFLPQAVTDFGKTIANAQKISECAIVITETACSAGNIGLAAGGLYIAGVSAQRYLKTNNTIAKFCYGASVCCSSTAAISGTLKAFGSACGISYVAMCGDAFGTSFLFLGNQARNLGDLTQGKSKRTSLNPFHNLRNRAFRRAPISKESGSGSIGFLTDSSWSSDQYYFSQIMTAIPFQKIILVGGSIVTVYVYGKFIISTYRYGQKLVSKLMGEKKINYSKLIRKQSVFLINSFNNPHIHSQLRIYKFALS